MKKYQIVFESEDVANAGSKAPSDIRKIANDLKRKGMQLFDVASTTSFDSL